MNELRARLRRTTPATRVAALGVLAALACIFFATYGALDAWALIGHLRMRRLGALVVVAVATAISTVLFHTAARNHILTPSVMGFDALYGLVQTVVVFLFGGLGLARFGEVQLFGLNVALMLVMSVGLFAVLFGSARYSLYLVVLIGIVAGTFLRSITSFLQRIIDPNDFLVLQESMFASFNSVDEKLLGVAGAVTVAVAVYVYWHRHELDVVGLGEETAVSLGVNHRRRTLVYLSLSALLVATSTALVGPVLFFGLLVAHLGYRIARSHKHSYSLLAASFAAIITLVGGQAILEHVFAQGTILSVVIDFLGGILFLILLVKGTK